MLGAVGADVRAAWARRGSPRRTTTLELTLTFLGVRRAIGVLGTTLPLVLLVGHSVEIGGWGLRDSLSSYYYTGMRDVFVAILCATGVFLASYRGYNAWDDTVTSVAGAASVVVALFPTTPPDPSTAERLVGHVHSTAAAVFYLAVALMSLALFTQTSGTPTPQKLRRNRVFRTCGWTVLGCLALVPVTAALPNALVAQVHPLFWLETGANLAFGVSWLVKGQAILADVVRTPRPGRPGPSA